MIQIPQKYLRVAIGLALSLSPLLVQSSGAATTPMVTVTMSRSELSAADQNVGGEKGTCVRDDANIATLDSVVLPWMALNTPNVHLTGSIETGVTKDATTWCPHYGETIGPSWADLMNMQTTYGMRFISHSATYAKNWSLLNSTQRRAETCGSRDTITQHGLIGANGQFNWPDNKLNASVQTNFVQKCFYFNRLYGSGLNTLPWTLANHNQVLTRGVSGGSCNTTGLACSTADTQKKYTLPASIISKIKNLNPGQYLSLQTYVLVTGANPAYSSTNNTQWDCTSSDPALHWSNDVERYCWSDFQQVLSYLQNDPSVTVTDPQTAAQAWGMAAPSL